MKNLLLTLSLVSLIFVFRIENVESLYESKNLMIQNLLQKFNIHHCVIVDDIEQILERIRNIKFFSESKIFTSFQKGEDFFNYLLVAKWNFKSSGSENNMAAFEKVGVVLTKGIYLKKLNLLLNYKRRYELFTWVVILESNTLGETPQVPLDSEFIYVYPNNTLMEYYNIREKSALQEYGKWDEANGLLLVNNQLFYGRRSNFRRAKVGFVAYAPGEYDCNFKKRLLTIPECIIYDIYSTFSRILNFSLVTPDFVNRDSIYKIRDGKSDLGDILSTNRHAYVKYPKVKEDPDYFIKPFSGNVWRAILGWIISLTCADILLYFCHTKVKRFSEILHFVFNPIETFCNQGEDVSTLNSSRILVLSSRFLAFFVVPAYSAFLFAFLAFRTPSLPEKNDVKSLLSSGYTFKIITFYNHKDDEYLFCDEKNLVISYRRIYPRCRVTTIIKDISPASIGVILRNTGLQFKGIFTEKLSFYRSSGVLQKAQKLFAQQSVQETSDWREEYPQVPLEQMTGLLCIVGGGIAVSLWICFAESIIDFTQNQKKRAAWRSKMTHIIFKIKNFNRNIIKV